MKFLLLLVLFCVNFINLQAIINGKVQNQNEYPWYGNVLFYDNQNFEKDKGSYSERIF